MFVGIYLLAMEPSVSAGSVPAIGLPTLVMPVPAVPVPASHVPDVSTSHVSTSHVPAVSASFNSDPMLLEKASFSLKNDPPYGNLKIGGKKPTFRSWSRTKKAHHVTHIPIIERTQQIKKKFSLGRNKSSNRVTIFLKNNKTRRKINDEIRTNSPSALKGTNSFFSFPTTDADRAVMVFLSAVTALAKSIRYLLDLFSNVFPSFKSVWTDWILPLLNCSNNCK